MPYRPLAVRSAAVGLVAVCLVAVVAIPVAADSASAAPAVAPHELARRAAGVALGAPLLVEELALAGEAAPVTLELERVRVWAPDAVVVVDGEPRPAPESRVFRGRVRGWAGSAAVIAVAADGEVSGLVVGERDAWALGGGRGGAVAARRIAAPATPALDPGSACEAPTLAPERRALRTAMSRLAAAAAASDAPQPLRAVAASDVPPAYHVTLAIETDWEYLRLFDTRPEPVLQALDYMALLVAYADLVTSRELDTGLSIGFTRLWTDLPETDPWTVTSTPADALVELRSHWNAEMQHVERSLVHFLSGKKLGGGAAFVGGLCESWDFPGASDDYGVTTHVLRRFDWGGDPAEQPSSATADVQSLLHQIGHAMGAGHTSDACGLGGIADPIDRCAAGCAGAAQGLPTCSSPTPHFDGGAGTLMSLCGEVAGDPADVALTFGAGHTCGELPYRMADAIAAFVADRAAAVPACLAPAGELLTVVKSGDGSGTVTSSPAGIDCGETCTATFTPGSEVTLTAAADPGSTFTGWSFSHRSGLSCTGATCVVPLHLARSVRAEFVGPNPCVDDDWEVLISGAPNDACYGDGVEMDTTQSHALCDDDWALFVPEQGGVYRIQSSNLTGGADTTFSLRQSCGAEILFNDDGPDGGGASRLDFTWTGPNTVLDLLIRQKGQDYGPQRGYELTVMCLANCGEPCDADVTVPAQTATGARIFKAADTLTLSPGFAVAATADVILQAGGRVALGDGFSVAAGGRLRVDTSPAPTCGPFHLVERGAPGGPAGTAVAAAAVPAP